MFKSANFYHMKVQLLILFSALCMFGCAQSAEIVVKEASPGAAGLDEYLPFISGKKIGVVANRGSVVGNNHLIDTLLSIQNDTNSFRIQKIFSPEHGFSGYYDAGKVIEHEGNYLDSIKIVSLYGKNKKPSTNHLTDLDLILFDLQDVGVRFYTYISTLHYVMEACAENDIPIIVLDRPNPHAHYIDGPVLQKKHQSFVGMHQVPVVYGMTIGEYALMINGEKWLKDSVRCDLTVIRNMNYSRDSLINIPIAPSPNLPNMRSVLLYPSLCFFEGTQVSIGRGTPDPFQVIGHPDYPARDFSFTPKSTPGASLYPKLEEETCYGVDLTTLSIDTLFRRNKLDISYLQNMFTALNTGDDFFTNYFELLTGTDSLRVQLLNGVTEKEIRETWQKGLTSFTKTRNKYLLYE